VVLPRGSRRPYTKGVVYAPRAGTFTLANVTRAKAALAATARQVQNRVAHCT